MFLRDKESHIRIGFTVFILLYYQRYGLRGGVGSNCYANNLKKAFDQFS